ncbi:hypothetical protein EXIGLDRAFT_771221 [Exidia glandulosa HHB12029]|uniref:Uncharacterized protein n=1 Tax=Exidia glandulosa HHB12029 TaxID=1314781 RepID=A0A165G5J7_EXIGL|nr:hypothetical protein EXIGLDRAFT_771221 [Exidia glandulosa HHB12029]
MTEDVARELLLPAVIRTMPRMVRLTFMACDNSCLRLFLDALTQPAPLLERLAVHGDDNHGRSAFKFSPTLFGGVAPVLRHLSCGSRERSLELLFGREPTPAFSLVSALQLFHEPAENLPAVLRLFPGVRHLDMRRCTKRFSLFSLSADVSEVQSYHTQVELLARQLCFLRMGNLEIPSSRCSITRLELATQAFAAFRDIPRVEVEFEYRELAIPEAVLEHMSSCSEIRADLHPHPKYSGSEISRPYRFRVNSRISLEKSRLIEVCGADDAWYCIKGLTGSVKGLVTELCMPQIFFTYCVQEIITCLPSLRTLRLDVYRYLPCELDETYEYGPALFRVGYRRGPESPDNPDDNWPTLRNLELLRIKAKGKRRVKVDEQSLFEFLQSLHFVGGQPRLVLAGPLNLVGDGEKKEASSFGALLGNKFSSVRFGRTEGGKPSFSAKA